MECERKKYVTLKRIRRRRKNNSSAHEMGWWDNSIKWIPSKKKKHYTYDKVKNCAENIYILCKQPWKKLVIQFEIPKLIKSIYDTSIKHVVRLIDVKIGWHVVLCICICEFSDKINEDLRTKRTTTTTNNDLLMKEIRV